MPVYLFKITLKSNKVITGLRNYDTHDIDYVYLRTFKKALEVYTTDLINLDVFMVHRLSKYYVQSADRYFGLDPVQKANA